MSPNFLVMALPRLLKAAEVFCPAVENVSDVFLYLEKQTKTTVYYLKMQLFSLSAEYGIVSQTNETNQTKSHP